MIHCPSCGSGLRFDIASQKTCCDHCRSFFEPEALPDSVYDDAETEKVFDSFRVICPDCGAELVTTDPNDAVGFCPYCGGASVIYDKLRKEWAPNGIIPFSVTKEQCRELYSKEVKKLDKIDIMIPASYMYTARDIMSHGRDIPEKYLATAHGDFRNAPFTHFYYGSSETLFAFAPSYAESYRKAGAKCMIHVGKGMHHCYALQYFIPGCKPAFNEIMMIIKKYFRKRGKDNG